MLKKLIKNKKTVLATKPSLTRFFIQKEFLLRDFFFSDIKDKFSLSGSFITAFEEYRKPEKGYNIEDYLVVISLFKKDMRVIEFDDNRVSLYSLSLYCNSEDLKYTNEIKLSNIAYEIISENKKNSLFKEVR